MKKSFSDNLGLYTFLLGILTFICSLPQIIKSFTETPDIHIGSLEITKKMINTGIIFAVFFAVIIVCMFVWRTRKEGAAIIAAASGNTVALCAILIEDCDTIKRTGKLRSVISKHKNRIIRYTSNTQAQIRGNINTVIDEDFLKEALKASKNDKAAKRFQPVIQAAYQKLAGLNSLDNFIRGEYRATLDEISGFILRWLKDEDIRQYLIINRELQQQILEIKKRRGGLFFFFINPELKDLLNLDLENEMMQTARKIPAFNIISDQDAFLFSTATVSSIGAVLAGLGIGDFDFSSLFGGDFADEIGSHVASELFEYAGAALPYIGFAFLFLKLFRYMGIFSRMADRSKELARVRETVAFQLSALVDSVCDKTTAEVEQSSMELVEKSKDRFLELQNKALSDLNRAKKML